MVAFAEDNVYNCCISIQKEAIDHLIEVPLHERELNLEKDIEAAKNTYKPKQEWVDIRPEGNSEFILSGFPSAFTKIDPMLEWVWQKSPDILDDVHFAVSFCKARLRYIPRRAARA